MNDIKEIQPNYCTLEQSVLLRAKGFIIPLKKVYTTKGDIRDSYYSTMSNSDIDDNTLCVAPEQHQVIEWLRVNHNIWIEIQLSFNSKYLCLLRSIKTPMVHIGFVRKTKYTSEFDSPQEAIEKAIDYVLEKMI